SAVTQPSFLTVAFALVAFYFVAPHLGYVRYSHLPQIEGVQHARGDDLGGELRLLGYDLNATQVKAGESVRLTLYWQPLKWLQTDYASFVHLDNPNTLETVAQNVNAHPGNISTIELPLSLYVRDPHVLEVPDRLEPGVYALRIGLLNTRDDTALAVMQPDGSRRTRVWLQSVRVHRAVPPDLRAITRANVRFGSIELLGYTLDSQRVLTTYWRALRTPNDDATLFVHLLDGTGQTVATFDAPPTNDLLPVSAWERDEVVVDRRALGASANGASRIALGLYDPNTLQRLPAQTSDGQRLSENQFVLDGVLAP
ncbi:MAG: hypothetical protein LC737_08050, partial [Chloroflexi bacterium]|nr:hypothetical protein [Chloroflexota bacterium]